MHWDVWGVLVRGSTSGWELVMSFPGQFIHHWSPPDIQLLPLAPRSGLHVTVATSQSMVLTGQLDQVRVLDRFQSLVELGTCLCQHSKTFPVIWVAETTWVQQP